LSLGRLLAIKRSDSDGERGRIELYDDGRLLKLGAV
jgi:hypothetical protein